MRTDVSTDLSLACSGEEDEIHPSNPERWGKIAPCRLGVPVSGGAGFMIMNRNKGITMT